MRSRAKINTSLFIAWNLHRNIQCLDGWIGCLDSALTLNRSGNRAQAEALFACILDQGPHLLSARAALALGSNRFQSGDFDAALRLYHAARNGEGLTKVLANLNTAAVVDVVGDHGRALRLLESVEPIVLMAGRHHPVITLSWLNSMSVALLGVGKVKEASRVFVTVARSPFQLPEWKETKAEIDAATPKGIIQIPTAYNNTIRCQRANLRLQRTIYRAQGNAPLLEDYASRLDGAR